MTLDRLIDRTWRMAAGALVALTAVVVSAHGTEAAQPAAAPAQQDEFVPIGELPPDEELPAAPLVIAAYALAWIIVMVYLWSIWRRISRVEGEIGAAMRRAGGAEPRGANAPHGGGAP